MVNAKSFSVIVAVIFANFFLQGDPSFAEHLDTLEIVKDGFHKWRESIPSLEIKYSLSNTRGRELLQRTVHLFRGLANLRYMYNEHEVGGIPVSLDVNHHEALYDGKSLLVLNHPNRQVAIRRNTAQVSSEDYQMPAYIRAVGWWPVNLLVDPPENQGVFKAPHIQFMTDKSRIKVSVVDARYYVVSFDQRERVWFDMMHDFSICRRELYTPSREFREVITLSDFRRVDDVWFPFEYRRFVEATNNGVEIDSPLTIGRLLSVRVGGLNKSDFAISLRPGTLVVDTDATEFSQVPGGMDQLDAIVDFHTRLNLLSHNSEKQHTVTTAMLQFRYFVLAITLVFLLLSSFFVRP